MRVVVAGLGVQGAKRLRVAGRDVVATVDPAVAGARYRRIEEVPLQSYDAVIASVPDHAKMALLAYALGHGKHALVEKPLLAASDDDIRRLAELAAARGAVCYTAYNHRFEPHILRVRELVRSGALGRIYSVRLFYGNGTARLVRESPWRDKGAGVLADLGSHLLDIVLFCFGRPESPFVVRAANRFENRAFDHVVLASEGHLSIQLEMTLLSWRNHFTADVLAENGSAHVESLCKWGPSTFRHRIRVLPSGLPQESVVTLAHGDPTWEAEYAHFLGLCASGAAPNPERDVWINAQVGRLAAEAISPRAA
ncbi:MAG: Gfo/Idh/MocA family protein [Alphaproteobacteria bacterium]